MSMDGRASAAIRWILQSLFVLIAACAGAPAANAADSTITVAGNRHVGTETIRSYFHPAADGRLRLIQQEVCGATIAVMSDGPYVLARVAPALVGA